MYRSILDLDHLLLIGLFSGDRNSDDDYQRYLDSLLEAHQQRVTAGGIAALIVERGNPIPNSRWRKHIADATGKLGTKETLFILCSDDPVMRGVATAINWLRPPSYETKVVPSIPALLEVVRARRPDAETRAAEMVGELQLGSA